MGDGESEMTESLEDVLSADVHKRQGGANGSVPFPHHEGRRENQSYHCCQHTVSSGRVSQEAIPKLRSCVASCLGLPSATILECMLFSASGDWRKYWWTTMCRVAEVVG